MPFESEAQRRFMFAKHPKLAEEFAKATPKGADLPEHVKSHMADGGLPDDDSETMRAAERIKESGKYDDTKPQPEISIPAPTTSIDTYKSNTGKMKAGYEMTAAHGGVVSDTDKLNAVYKAMGMEKYANGGITPAIPAENPMGMPDPADPTYWDKVKSALAQVSAPITKPIGAAMDLSANTAKAITPAIEGVAPATISALNNLTGASLPVPAPKTPDLGVPTPLSTNLPPVIPPVMPPSAPKMGDLPVNNDLKNLFNQDTSKLTEGATAEDRQQLAAKQAGGQHGLGSMIAEAVAGLGDALAAKGGREQHSLKDIFSMQKQQRDEALANFDKARQDKLEKLDIQTKLANNLLTKMAAKDKYGVTESLNKAYGAPPETTHDQLITLYAPLVAAKVAANDKEAELYLKSHAQASADTDNAIKNATIIGFKPTPEQIQARGNQLAQKYFAQAKGLYHSATNPQTGHRVESFDGGQSWNDAGAK